MADPIKYTIIDTLRTCLAGITVAGGYDTEVTEVFIEEDMPDPTDLDAWEKQVQYPIIVIHETVPDTVHQTQGGGGGGCRPVYYNLRVAGMLHTTLDLELKLNKFEIDIQTCLKSAACKIARTNLLIDSPRQEMDKPKGVVMIDIRMWHTSDI